MSPEASTSDRSILLDAFRAVRAASMAMCRPLAPEDYRIQPRAEVSPPWWNLGHTSWFFARNALQPFGGQYTERDAQLDFLLNSYYVSLGPRVKRGLRGHMARPTNAEIHAYRDDVDRRVEQLVMSISSERLEELALVLTVGGHHEQQHQELFHTEIKAIYHQLPRDLRPTYRVSDEPAAIAPGELSFTEFGGGLFEFGHRGDGFAWDNEQPVHRAYLVPFALADRPVTCGEYLCFIDDGGYDNPLLWLDNGWAFAREAGWRAPLYWEQRDGHWWQFTLGGMRRVDHADPVCHVSFYEADAYARWADLTLDAGAPIRLPTEYEWEHAARRSDASIAGANLLESGRLHPRPGDNGGLGQLVGDVWEWTASPYQPYPGFRPLPGALTEYNAKFMDNQRVLRGGSCFTPTTHIRPSYRNFWSPETRFQMSGFRLARGG